MRLGSLIGLAIVLLGLLFFGANGYLPVPDSVRQMWDKNYERNVEPAKEKLEEMKEKAESQTQTPAPDQAHLGVAAFTIDCTLPACAAA